METEPRIRAAIDEVHAAKDKLDRVVSGMCPVGSLVRFSPRQSVECYGRVIFNCGERLKIRNVNTGNEYFIYAYTVLSVDEGDNRE